MVKDPKEETEILAKSLKNVCGEIHCSKLAVLDPTSLLKDKLRKWYISNILPRL